MRIRSYCLTGIIFLMITTGCTKDYTVPLETTKPLYVIEGRISTLTGPYYVRITKSTNYLALNTDFLGNTFDSAEAVKGAQVIITDDRGVADTLIPAHIEPRYEYYPQLSGVLDSIYVQNTPSTMYFTIDQGYYETTKTVALPGHTYHLQVRIGSEEFHSSAYMPAVPALDSAAVKDTIVDPDGTRGYLPLVYFKEPQNEKNYYLLQFNDLTDYPYDKTHIESGYTHYMVLPFYVVDDKLLPPYVHGLAVRVIISSQYKFSSSYPYVSFINPLQVKLSSLTPEAYDYFNELGKQFQNDGNVYKPTPASATGNISGGALGLFWASDVSYKVVWP